jgi:aquaporin related protein
MSSSGLSDSPNTAGRDTSPSHLPLWRRPLRRLQTHSKETRGTNLTLTTSAGKVYLLDQFRERVPMRIRNRSIAMFSEFVGAFLFMLVGIGGNSTVIHGPAKAMQYGGGDMMADPAKILFVATVWGMAVSVNAWAFFHVSGGLFNPAVTMVASIAAAATCYGLLPEGSLAKTELGEYTSVTQGLFIEMFITAQAVVAVSMLATEKHKAAFIAPVGIGMSVFASVCMAATYTGAGINPARAFAVCAVTGSFPHFHWIYWVGPGMGARLATAFYLLIPKLEYWTVNPDVDDYQSKIGEGVLDIASRVR